MAKRQKQLEFLGKSFERPGGAFGGSLLKSNPKTKRPLDAKLPIHLVLRAVRGGMRLPKTFAIVEEIVEHIARKHGVTIYRRANVGNHLHFVLKIGHIRHWAAFIRELTGRLAQVIKEILGMKDGEKFWRFRPYTRIVRGWRKAFRDALEYVQLNQLEAEGFISRRETKTLKDLRLIWADG